MNDRSHSKACLLTKKLSQLPASSTTTAAAPVGSACLPASPAAPMLSHSLNALPRPLKGLLETSDELISDAARILQSHEDGMWLASYIQLEQMWSLTHQGLMKTFADLQEANQ